MSDPKDATIIVSHQGERFDGVNDNPGDRRMNERMSEAERRETVSKAKRMGRVAHDKPTPEDLE